MTNGDDYYVLGLSEYSARWVVLWSGQTSMEARLAFEEWKKELKPGGYHAVKMVDTEILMLDTRRA